MESQNNNKGIIVLLVVIIVILAVLCVLFATRTISLKSNTTENNQQTNTNDSQQTNDNDYEAEAIAKEKMPVAISLANQEHKAITYCGGFKDNDMIVVDTDVDYVKITMDASSKFNNLNDLKKHLKENISEELINKYFKTKENSYLEKDGKLYCQSSHKDIEWISVGNEDRINIDNPIEYTISDKKDNSFNVKVEAKYGLLGSYERNQTVTINSTITKINDNWLVTKYEQN